MIKAEYDKIVSLGGSCETAWRIRERFGVEAAYPFDWWITQLHRIAPIIERGFAGVFRPENLSPVEYCGQPGIKSALDGIVHLHDFHLDNDGSYGAGWQEEIIPVQQKFKFLAERFSSHLSTGRTLLIRKMIADDGWFKDKWRETSFEIVERVRLLFPDASVEFLFLGYGDHVTELSGVHWDDVEKYDDVQGFAGSNRGWAELWERHEISLLPKPHAEKLSAMMDTVTI